MTQATHANNVDQYAVVGDPIAHSKSPLIHAAFAEQTGQQLEYGRIQVPAGQLSAAVAAFRRRGGKGLNVTVPLKEEAYQLVTEHSPRAQLAGAVNTLLLQPDGGIHGDNTDGPGLVRDLLDNHHIALRGKRLLLVGAGGAARGVIGPLLDQAPQALFIVNRTAARAEQLAAHFRDYSDTPIQAGGFDALPDQAFDLVINATAASLAGEAPPLPESVLAADATAYDLMYATEPTPFLRWASALTSGPCVDGLGMLVEQAAESFYLWRGQRPDTGPVIGSLHNTLPKA